MNESKSPQFSFLIIIILLISLSTQAQAQAQAQAQNPIQLPSQSDNADVCPLGLLGPADLCPVKCFRPDPVCGVDGVTYWCGCADARCAGARVAKIGFCEVGNGASGQAFLLVHIVWLILLGIFVLFGLL